MKVLLINPSIREWAKPNCVPLGLGYLASMLIRAGHEVDVLDINALRLPAAAVEEYIASSDHDVFGTGGLITVYGQVKEIVGLCKKYHPNRPVMVGGSVSTSIPATIMSKNDVDVACIGEGEITTVEVVNALETGRPLEDVTGIWFKNRNGEIITNPPRPLIQNIDEIPLPAYDLFPMDVYLENPIGWLNAKKWDDGGVETNCPKSINLLSSRGCVFNCIYCYHDFMGAKYRKRSPMNIIGEIEFLIDKYGPYYFHFIDDNFVTIRDNVFEFCRLVHERGLDITWGCSGRINSMDERMLIAMRDAGCKFITYGIESGSQRMLNAMKKKVKVEDVKRVVRQTTDIIGEPSCTFIVGTPGEDQASIQETIDFCRDVELSPEAIFFMTPYPGTELYRTALEQGRLTLENEEEFVLSLGEQGEQMLLNFSALSDEELWQAKWRMAEELKAQNLKKHVLHEDLDIPPDDRGRTLDGGEG